MAEKTEIKAGLTEIADTIRFKQCKFKDWTDEEREKARDSTEKLLKASDFASEIMKIDRLQNMHYYTKSFDNEDAGQAAADVIKTYWTARDSVQSVDSETEYDGKKNLFFYYNTTPFNSGHCVYIQVDGKNKYLIDCSTLVGFALRGIEFKYSPYGQAEAQLEKSKRQVQDEYIKNYKSVNFGTWSGYKTDMVFYIGGKDDTTEEYNTITKKQSTDLFHTWEIDSDKGKSIEDIYDSQEDNKKSWRFSNLDRQPKEGLFKKTKFYGDDFTTIRGAADQGEFFYKYGYVLYDKVVDNALTETKANNLTKKLKPGDLVFWSEGGASEKQQTRFRGISHVAMMINSEEYIEASKGKGIVRKETFIKNYKSVVLICRPNYNRNNNK